MRALFALAVARACSVLPSNVVMPLPQRLTTEGCCTVLARHVDLSVVGADSADVIDAWAPSAAASCADAVPVRQIQVEVGTRARELPADESYSLSCDEERAGHAVCRLRAATVFGARYGLDTLAQLFSSGVAARRIEVDDAPSKAYRGLMVDTGRRFIPMAWLQETLRGMETARLNVLHLHLNDFCRFAVDLPDFPAIAQSQTGLLNGTYSVAELRDLVARAARRGIRVVPELDVPGHASALARGTGMRACVRDPSAGGVKPEHSVALLNEESTRRTLRRLYAALADIFPGELMHLGADEAGNAIGRCDVLNAQRLEAFAVETIRKLGRTPVAWGDVKVQDSNLEIENWNTPAVKAEVRGTRVVRNTGAIDAFFENSYLDFSYHEHPPSNFWAPVAHGALGGEAAIWTDNYCFAPQCGHASADVTPRPKVPGMFQRAADSAFEQSLSGMVWPRAYVKGAALWRYDRTRASATTVLAGAYRRLAAASVDGCPEGCHCDEATRCGEVYGTDDDQDDAGSCFTAYSGRTLDGEAATPLDLRSALQLCVWTGCAGVVCNDDECVACKLDSDCNLVTPDANYSRDNGNVTAYVPNGNCRPAPPTRRVALLRRALVRTAA